MLSILYMCISLGVGCLFTGYFFTGLKKLTCFSKDGKAYRLPSYFALLPAWYVTGTLVVTWTVYLTAYLFQNQKTPLIFGNAIAMGLWGVVIVLFAVWQVVKKGRKPSKRAVYEFFMGSDISWNIFTIIVVAFVSFLMYLTFNFKNGTLNVGFSVFSDFAPHLGMIRSFSHSNNFPTQYAHFAGEDIKYHFMFQFLVGNLEFLGLRVDHAFNIPSIMNMVSVYFLLAILAVNLFKSRAVAYIGAFFFTFRSAFSFFKYAATIRKGVFWEVVKETTDFFNYTEHEDWGLWNLNVYANQRHLCFGIAAMILTVLLFYGHLTKTEDVLQSGKGGTEEKLGFGKALKLIFFTKDAWSPEQFKMGLGCGLMLGFLAFWHGSAVIGCLAILFFMAAFSQNRIDYIVTAVLAVAFSFAQTNFFINGSAVAPTYFFGFLAENKTFFGVLEYIFELTGIVILLAVLGAGMVRGVKRYMVLCLSLPFIMSFFLSLTPDITVNHKWIMISLMFLSVYAAYFVVSLFKNRDWFKRALAIILVCCMTFTGIFEFTVVIKRNENYLRFDPNDPVTEWISDNATCDDVFLTPWYSLNNVVLGGAMLYYGWPYYAYSAGYDTHYRERVVKTIYEAAQPVDYLCKIHGIRYVIIDHDARTSSEYRLNEAAFEETFEEVFSYDTGDWKVRIFDTTKVIR